MAYQISSTRIDRIRTRAFTLVEVMVSLGIGTFILGGVLSTFLMIGRTGANDANYCDLDSAAHQGLEIFGREVRNASSVATPFSSTSVTLTIPDTNSVTANSYTATYSYDSVQQTFTRTGPSWTNPFNSDGTVAASTPTTLISGVQPGSFAMKYFSLEPGYINGPGYGPGNSPPNNEIDPTQSQNAVAIKQIELALTAQLSSSTVVTASNVVLSACFTLRNK